MVAKLGPAEDGFDEARRAAARRHNAILVEHNGTPVSYGLGVYITCACKQFHGTFAGYEEHCQHQVVDSPVAR